MPLKSKSVMTKAGDRHRVTISTLDNDVKAGPLDPEIIARIKGIETVSVFLYILILLYT